MTSQEIAKTKDVEYETTLGTVKLNPAIVRRWCKEASETEAFEFIQFCRFMGLNPYLHEAYLVKYGSDPAQVIVDYHWFIRRTAQLEGYKGYRSGVIIQRGDDIMEMKDAFCLPTDRLLGAWCEVDIEGLSPFRVALPLDQMQQTKRDGNPNHFWKKMPNLMAEKVVIAQAHRRADRTGILQGAYIEGETAQEVEALPVIEEDAPTPEAGSKGLFPPEFAG